jgi:glycosyltransferase involved in cell wall biosynthesis
MSSLDIIVPCYRYGRYLHECVTSLLTQSFHNIRIAIINDASPDHTAEVASNLVKQDSRVSYIEHSTNKGHIYTYNEGIDWVSSDYLLLLSADDYLLPGALQRAVAIMERHPEVGLTFGNAFEMDEQGRQTVTNCVACQNGGRVLSGSEFLSLSGARNIVPTPTAVVRTALQKKVGGYRAELPHSGDMELWFRLAAQSSVGFIPVPQAVYRRHANNMSLSYAGQAYLPDLAQRKAALKYFFESCESLMPKPRQVRRRMLSSLAIEAVGCASTAFNDGNSGLMNDLLTFALEMSPSARFSPAWAKLACKRTVGLKAWQILSSGRLLRATHCSPDPRDTVGESRQ